MKPIEKRTRERIENNEKIRLFKSFLWNIKEVELKIFIKDILEDEVDIKYYLSEKLQERFKKYLEDKNRICNLQPRSPTRPSLLKSKNAGGSGLLTKNDGTTYCIDQNNTQGIVAMRQRDRHGKNEKREQQIEPRKDECSNSLTSVQKDNLVYDSHRKGEIREYKNVSNTLSQAMGTGGNNVPMVKCGKLRRLTPKECFRLMGFLNDEINLDSLSDTQRYKLAGNGQDVNLVSLIFKEMFKSWRKKNE